MARAALNTDGMDDDPRLAALAARIAAGEAIDAATLAPELRNDPRVRRLLRFAGVAAVLAENAILRPQAAGAPDSIGPWRLVRHLGSGGMGEVWLGERRDGTVEQKVAIKRVRGANPAFAERLRAERRILARLSHPRIARFIDAGVDGGGAPWLAMEYVEGVPLSEWCDQARPTLPDRLAVFRAICDAVAHAHAQLVVHRDLKPGNVLIDADGRPRLLDFGVAKLLDETADANTTAALTPAYAAPEQLTGGVVSTATDVYALGLLLFRMLAGTLPPTRADASVAQVLAHLHDEETQQPSRAARNAPAPLPYAADALAGDLDAIVSKAIRAAPEARYASVADLAADIDRHLAARPVRARAPTRWYRAGRFVRRNPLPLALGSLAALALVAVAVVSLLGFRRAEALRLDAEAALARANAANAFIGDLFERAGPAGLGPRATLRDLLDSAPALLDARSTMRGTDRAHLLELLAGIEGGMGNDEAAARLATEAARLLAEAMPGSEQALRLQAEALRVRALVGDARESVREGLALLAQVEATAHPPALRAFVLACLAEAEFRAHRIASEPGGAARIAARLAQALEVPGLLPPRNEAEALRRWAALELEAGNSDAAAALAARAVAVAESGLGRSHPIAAIARRGLGWMYAEHGDGARAEALFRDNLALYVERVGRGSLMAADDLLGLAQALLVQSKPLDALPVAREAHDAAQAQAVPDGRLVVDSALVLAEALQGTGAHAEADALLEDTRARIASTRGTRNRPYWLATRQLALVRIARGDLQAARPLLAACATEGALSLGAEVPLVRQCVEKLAQIAAPPDAPSPAPTLIR
ncbi:MAG: serine/threonine protein kinase [Xanthomonadaceae bacterium]|nr:serine/threonine protein kinase [Xanthomonadaceae bacterium]